MYDRPGWSIFTFVLRGEISMFEACAQSVSFCHLSEMRIVLQFWLLWFYWQECRLSNDVTRAHEWMTSLCLPCLERMKIYITQQSESVMESWRTSLSGDDIERILEETLLASESSLFDSDDDQCNWRFENSRSKWQLTVTVWEIQQVLCRAGLVIHLLCGRTCQR
jgi:hypothetical protein